MGRWRESDSGVATVVYGVRGVVIRVFVEIVLLKAQEDWKSRCVRLAVLGLVFL